MADFITLTSTSKESLETNIKVYQMKGYVKVGDIYEATESGITIYFQQMRKR